MDPFWFQTISLAINGTLLLLAIKGTMVFSDIKFKVDLMWKTFEQKFERRGDEFIERPKHQQKRDY